MSGTRPSTLACPDCRAGLTQDRTKMNVVIDVCPRHHGIFFDHDDLAQMIGAEATVKIHDLIGKSPPAHGECPNCRQTLRGAVLDPMPVRGCRNCGSLWFDNEALRAHVLEVRKRAYGEGSMAARADVMRDATAFYPGEVAAGILTEFALEDENRA